ncbi:MAG: GNAT family N-acetyltransferase, partial [Treponemataceae bacterium]|nr:GNAT family N-acetyltransferase [Treponemataceae bacterium]
MKITRAQKSDMDGINKLLYQVAMVHHQGRPDIFKGGSKKYNDEELLEIIEDDSKPIFVAKNEEGQVLGYAFCIFKQYCNDNILTD